MSKVYFYCTLLRVLRDSQVVLVVKNLLASAGDLRDHGFDPWVGKTPWRREWQPTPVFLPGKFQDKGTWQTTVYGVAKSDMT